MEGKSQNKTTKLASIDSLPNLRVLCKHSERQQNAEQLPGTAAIYRSAKPDRIISEDLDKFRKLGIKCIVDFRSETEYKGTDGHRLLDMEYPVYKVKISSQGGVKGSSPLYTFKPLSSTKSPSLQAESHEQCTSSSEEMPADDVHCGSQKTPDFLRNRFDKGSTSASNQTQRYYTSAPGPAKQSQSHEEVRALDERKHLLINFFPFKFILRILFSLPWHSVVMGLLLIVLDLVRMNKFKTFTKFFIQECVNRKGIVGQYIDISECSQPSICTALKLVSDPNNLPILINCAHGKDRTGIISALILSCLGMPKEYVAEEYALSHEGLAPVRHLLYRDIVEKYNFKEEFCSSDASTMLHLLNHIENKYGSVENYMTHIGFTAEDQDRLRQVVDAYDHPEVGKCETENGASLQPSDRKGAGETS